MPKRAKPSATPAPIPFSIDDYFSQRRLAKQIGCSIVTAGKLVAQLDLPFVILNGRKLWRYSAIAEILKARETTLSQVRSEVRGKRGRR